MSKKHKNDSASNNNNEIESLGEDLLKSSTEGISYKKPKVCLQCGRKVLPSLQRKIEYQFSRKDCRNCHCPTCEFGYGVPGEEVSDAAAFEKREVQPNTEEIRYIKNNACKCNRVATNKNKNKDDVHYNTDCKNCHCHTGAEKSPMRQIEYSKPMPKSRAFKSRPAYTKPRPGSRRLLTHYGPSALKDSREGPYKFRHKPPDEADKKDRMRERYFSNERRIRSREGPLSSIESPSYTREDFYDTNKFYKYAKKPPSAKQKSSREKQRKAENPYWTETDSFFKEKVPRYKEKALASKQIPSVLTSDSDRETTRRSPKPADCICQCGAGEYFKHCKCSKKIPCTGSLRDRLQSEKSTKCEERNCVCAEDEHKKKLSPIDKGQQTLPRVTANVGTTVKPASELKKKLKSIPEKAEFKKSSAVRKPYRRKQCFRKPSFSSDKTEELIKSIDLDLGSTSLKMEHKETEKEMKKEKDKKNEMEKEKDGEKEKDEEKETDEEKDKYKDRYNDIIKDNIKPMKRSSQLRNRVDNITEKVVKNILEAVRLSKPTQDSPAKVRLEVVRCARSSRVSITLKENKNGDVSKDTASVQSSSPIKDVKAPVLSTIISENIKPISEDALEDVESKKDINQKINQSMIALKKVLEEVRHRPSRIISTDSFGLDIIHGSDKDMKSPKEITKSKSTHVKNKFSTEILTAPQLNKGDKISAHTVKIESDEERKSKAYSVAVDLLNDIELILKNVMSDKLLPISSKLKLAEQGNKKSTAKVKKEIKGDTIVQKRKELTPAINKSLIEREKTNEISNIGKQEITGTKSEELTTQQPEDQNKSLVFLKISSLASVKQTDDLLKETQGRKKDPVIITKPPSSVFGEEVLNIEDQIILDVSDTTIEKKGEEIVVNVSGIDTMELELDGDLLKAKFTKEIPTLSLKSETSITAAEDTKVLQKYVKPKNLKFDKKMDKEIKEKSSKEMVVDVFPKTTSDFKTKSSPTKISLKDVEVVTNSFNKPSVTLKDKDSKAKVPVKFRFWGYIADVSSEDMDHKISGRGSDDVKTTKELDYTKEYSSQNEMNTSDANLKNDVKTTPFKAIEKDLSIIAKSSPTEIPLNEVNEMTDSLKKSSVVPKNKDRQEKVPLELITDVSPEVIDFKVSEEVADDIKTKKELKDTKEQKSEKSSLLEVKSDNLKEKSLKNNDKINIADDIKTKKELKDTNEQKSKTKDLPEVKSNDLKEKSLKDNDKINIADDIKTKKELKDTNEQKSITRGLPEVKSNDLKEKSLKDNDKINISEVNLKNDVKTAFIKEIVKDISVNSIPVTLVTPLKELKDIPDPLKNVSVTLNDKVSKSKVTEKMITDVVPEVISQKATDTMKTTRIEDRKGVQSQKMYLSDIKLDDLKEKALKDVDEINISDIRKKDDKTPLIKPIEKDKSIIVKSSLLWTSTKISIKDVKSIKDPSLSEKVSVDLKTTKDLKKDTKEHKSEKTDTSENKPDDSKGRSLKDIDAINISDVNPKNDAEVAKGGKDKTNVKSTIETKPNIKIKSMNISGIKLKDKKVLKSMEDDGIKVASSNMVDIKPQDHVNRESSIGIKTDAKMIPKKNGKLGDTRNKVFEKPSKNIKTDLQTSEMSEETKDDKGAIKTKPVKKMDSKKATVSKIGTLKRKELPILDNKKDLPRKKLAVATKVSDNIPESKKLMSEMSTSVDDSIKNAQQLETPTESQIEKLITVVRLDTFATEKEKSIKKKDIKSVGKQLKSVKKEDSNQFKRKAPPTKSGSKKRKSLISGRLSLRKASQEFPALYSEDAIFSKIITEATEKHSIEVTKEEIKKKQESVTSRQSRKKSDLISEKSKKDSGAIFTHQSSPVLNVSTGSTFCKDCSILSATLPSLSSDDSSYTIITPILKLKDGSLEMEMHLEESSSQGTKLVLEIEVADDSDFSYEEDNESEER